MIDRPPPDDREAVAATMLLTPAASRLVARQLRREATVARTKGDLVQTSKLSARADLLCPPERPDLSTQVLTS